MGASRDIITLASGLWLAALGCGPAPTPPGPVLGPRGGSVVIPARTPAGELEAYAFGQAEWTPVHAGSDPLELSPGGGDPRAGSLFFAGLDEPAGQPPAWVAPAGVHFEHVGSAGVPGRFGRALGLADASSARLTFDPVALVDSPWTLEFWWRPTRLAEAPLVQARDSEEAPLWTLALEDSGTLRLRAGQPGPRDSELLSAEPLRVERWNHIALALGGPELPQLRLVVNGRPAGRPQGILRTGMRTLEFGGAGGALDEPRLSPRALSSAELEEHWRATPPVGTQRLRLRRAGVESTLETFQGTLDVPRVEGAGWASGSLERVLPDADGLRWVPAHWTRLRTNAPPLPRTTHCTVQLDDGRLFLFGGETVDSFLPPMRNTGDAWIFSWREGTWTRQVYAQDPPGRCHQFAAYSPQHDLVLYPGGYVNELRGNERMSFELEDTLRFHVSEGRWDRATRAGSPGETSNGVTLYVPELGGFVYFMPARRGSWFYDPERDRWRTQRYEAVDADGASLDHRFRSSAMMARRTRTGEFLLFGGGSGANEATFHDETGLYDPRTNRIVFLDLEPRPPARVRGTLAYDEAGDRFLLFGGVRDQYSERDADLWVFDPEQPSWARVEASGTPLARGGYHGGAFDPLTRSLVVVCGRHAVRHFLDDAWSLQLDETLPGRARYRFDRLTFPEARQLSCRWSGPAGSRVEGRLRSSADGLHFGPWSPLAGGMVDAEGRFVEVELELFGLDLRRGPRIEALEFMPASGMSSDPEGEERTLRAEVLALDPRPGAGPG